MYEHGSADLQEGVPSWVHYSVIMRLRVVVFGCFHGSSKGESQVNLNKSLGEAVSNSKQVANRLAFSCSAKASMVAIGGCSGAVVARDVTNGPFVACEADDIRPLSWNDHLKARIH